MHRLIWFVLSWSWLGFGMVWGQSKASDKVTLGAGDIISVYSGSYKNLNRKWTVDRRGRIRLPLVGWVSVEGRTPREATRFLARRLSSYYQSLSKFRVSVIKRKKFVWVRGWVKKPGVYHVGWKDSLDTLLKLAVARPGARLDRVWIRVRGSKVSARSFNLLEYYTSKGSKKLPFVPRNGEVFVEAGGAQNLSANKSSVAVVGAVKRTGVFPCLKPLTLLQVLSLAGGPMPRAGLHEVVISSKGGAVRWFDLAAYLRGNMKPSLPMISPGSVVFVPSGTGMGASGRGPVRVLGHVSKPGIWRGRRAPSLPTLLAESGGPRADADLTSVKVVVEGRNFTISQEVDASKAMSTGRMDLLPPSTEDAVIVYVPSRTNYAMRDIQGWLQVGVAVASIVTSVVLVVTLTR